MDRELVVSNYLLSSFQKQSPIVCIGVSTPSQKTPPPLFRQAPF